MPLLAPSRIADNTPSDTLGRGYLRAVAFGLDERFGWAFGGFSATANFSDEIWRHDFDLNIWTNAGLTFMPVAVRFQERASGNFGNKLIGVGDVGGTARTAYIYDIDLNTWASAAAPGTWTWGPCGTVAEQFFYEIQGAAARRLERLDIDNPGAGWTALTAPPASIGITQGGIAIQDPVLTDRIVVFERDAGGLHYYSISGDSWVDLGNIWTVGPPTIVFSVPGVGIYAARFVAGAPDSLVVSRLDWTIPSFIQEDTWPDADFHANIIYVAHVALSGPTPRTRILFGSKFTSLAAPAAGGEKWWGGVTFEPAPPVVPPPAVFPPGGAYNRALSGGAPGFATYITPDGRLYPLHTPHEFGRWVISFSGLGTPPVEYITERGPFQHGATARDYFLRPRVVQLLIRQAFCDRLDWWAGRAALLNEIRPNRQATPTAVAPGELRFMETDGTLRSLNVFIQEGPRFEPRQSDQWAFQEVLRFIAYDPVVFDPTQATAAFPVALESDLVFPITFPIRFGSGDLDETFNVTYPGTWLSFPVITIVGPIELPRLDNVTTGEKLQFGTNIAPGTTVTIELTEGNKTIVDQLGNNLIGQLSSDSDLGTFHLAPDPEAPLGVNVLRLRGTNPTGATAVSLAYFERYFGF